MIVIIHMRVFSYYCTYTSGIIRRLYRRIQSYPHRTTVMKRNVPNVKHKITELAVVGYSYRVL